MAKANAPAALYARIAGLRVYRMLSISKHPANALIAVTARRENTQGSERRRYGEAGSTVFVEPTVDQIVAKRFAKKQQM